MMTQLTKTIQEIGNGAHIYMPKELIGKKVTITLVEKTIEEIENEILQILKPYLKHIIGIYLYGSYARNEALPESDIDIFVITDEKIKIKNKINEYEITSGTIAQIERTIENNAVLILPIIKECKTIINESLIEKLEKKKINKKNTKWYIDTTSTSLNIAKELIKNADIKGMPNTVYPIMMRLKGLYLIKSLIKDKKYSNKEFEQYLINKGLSKEKVKQLYRMYMENRDKKIISKHSLNYNDVNKLFNITYDFLKGVKSLWEKLD